MKDLRAWGRWLPASLKRHLRPRSRTPVPEPASALPWNAHQLKFGFDGSQAVLRFRIERPGWRLRGLQLRARHGKLKLPVGVSKPDKTGLVTARVDAARLMDQHGFAQESLDFYLEWSRKKKILRQRLGQFTETVRSRRSYGTTVDGVEVLLESTVTGNVSLRFNDEQPHRTRPRFTHYIRTRDGTRLTFEIKTFNRPLQRATLVIWGRQSQSRTEVELPVTFLAQRTRREWGLMSFRVQVALDFDTIARTLTPLDDTVDLAVELRLEGETEPRRIGLQLPDGIPEHRLKSSAAHVRGRALLFVPYLTFRRHYLTYRVESFPSADYRFLRRLLWVSWAFPLIKPFTRIWLVGEVPYKAQDNGYFFFRHIRQQHPRRRAYYVIDASSPDREKVAPLGRVVDRFSRQHMLYSLLASRLVGSHHSEYLFASRDPAVARRTRAVRVFLQHGITASKNVTANYARQQTFELPTERFLVASDLERKIVVEDYGYRPHQVRVTGFARFDALFADSGPPERTVLIMPTWREALSRTEIFLSSDYYANWHGFLADPALQDLLRAYDMEVKFVLHPNMRLFADHFNIPHVRLVRQEEVDVQQLIKSSAVLITDFSSVAWDFSFLRRPVLYFQFDQTHLVGQRAPHVDFLEYLPGPIATTPERLLAELSQVFARRGELDPVYWSRARRFLTYRDQQNCARIYQTVARAWTPATAWSRVANARAVQRRWLRFRRSPEYFVWLGRLFSVGRLLPRRNTVVFECDRGAHYGDAPRYLYERLIRRPHNLKIIWANNTTLRLPDPATRKIKRYSPRYFWELSRARYWVNNQNFSTELAKPVGTRFLQTWHGTPLKRMQHDVENMSSRDPDYHERAARLTSYWDALLSGSSYATRCFRSAFRFDGPILELGYPRNDLFSWPDAAERAALVRGRLGLTDDPRKILLYAPTFRDDNRPGVNWRHKLVLDLRRMREEFADEYVLVVRFHQLVRESLPRTGELGNFLIDGSSYPDIGELALVSDVLITDYSSILFDYAVLRRPMLFFTYDLANYRDALRGFYLDFESVAPGPLLSTNDELFAALHALDEVSTTYADRIEEFAATYCPRDDGSASDRVLDAFFQPTDLGGSSANDLPQAPPVLAQVKGEARPEGIVGEAAGRHG